MVDHFENYADLEQKLADGGKYDIIKVPMDRAAEIASKGYIRPVSDVATPAEAIRIRQAFSLPPLAASGDTLYYIPRKLETRIMVYRISKVEQALREYADCAAPLDSAIRSFAGRGLPSGYILEKDPNKWDYYDVLMAGFVWNDKGIGFGKIGHGGAPGSSLSMFFLHNILNFGN